MCELRDLYAWYLLGVYLGLPKATLDQIHADYGEGVCICQCVSVYVCVCVCVCLICARECHKNKLSFLDSQSQASSKF